jgi:Trypsin-co-occurring domain 2
MVSPKGAIDPDPVATASPKAITHGQPSLAEAPGHERSTETDVCGKGPLVDHAVELADLIGQLRHELSVAMSAGEGTDLRFEPGPVELELTVGVQKEAGPDAKVRFWVLDVGASAKRSSMVTQRIKLTLDPRLGSSPDRRPLIFGESLQDER